MEKALLKKLVDYQKSGVYPFHMPGHKRQQLYGYGKELPFQIDITEIDGFDNLHHPEAILKQSMENVSKFYGSFKSYYLVNGSTGGILSAMSGVFNFQEVVLMARNCHKSAYHGLLLAQLKAYYLYPKEIEELGIQGGIDVNEAREMLDKYSDIKGIFIVSPTYDGIVSDVKALSELAHEFGIPLIVDEAHGAHFPFAKEFPVSALELGADIVIQSLHKTLPSLTQTAILHVREGMVDIGRLEYFLSVYQTSSPSYVFLASIESCISFMRQEGQSMVRDYYSLLIEARKELSQLKLIRLLEKEWIGTRGIFDLDPSKIVISLKGTNLDGGKGMEFLREMYSLELEMSSICTMTALTSVFDKREGFKRLVEGFFELDRNALMEYKECNPISLKSYPKPGEGMTIGKAFYEEKQFVSLKNSIGRVSGEFAYIYPPGIPLIVPGERIEASIVEFMEQYKKYGFVIQGLADKENHQILVLK